MFFACTCSNLKHLYRHSETVFIGHFPRVFCVLQIVQYNSLSLYLCDHIISPISSIAFYHMVCTKTAWITGYWVLHWFLMKVVSVGSCQMVHNI